MNKDDPRLTAYLLGELSPKEMEEVCQAIESDAKLRKEAERIGIFCKSLEESFAGERASLTSRQRSKVMRAAREVARNGKVQQLSSHKQAKRLNFWTLPLAAAAVVAGGLFVVTMFPSDRKNEGGGTKQVATAGVEGAGNLKERIHKDTDFTQLPLAAGNKSLAEITRAVRTDKVMPKPEEVRIEELLKAFPLHVDDSVALWKGCSIGTEILSCPWRPSSSLVVIDIRGDRKTSKELGVRFVPAAESVLGYRVLGYRGQSNSTSVPATTEIPAGEGAFLVIEVESKDSEIGHLEWSVDGDVAPLLKLQPDQEKEPSDDGRFAALVCIYGLWLEGARSGLIDSSMVLGMAREVAAESMAPDRFDFLNLVDESVKLSGE